MNKNIYEMLNDSKINIEDRKVEMVSELEKARMKKKFKKTLNNNRKSNKKKIIVVAMAMTLTVGMFTPTVSEKVFAAINIISTDIATKLLLDKNLDDYKTVVGKVITDNGTSIALNEVILDQDTLSVSTTIKTTEKLDVMGIQPLANVKINGKEISLGSTGAYKKIDDNTTESIMKYEIGNIDITENLNIEINYNGSVANDNELKGNWDFSFNTNGANLVKETKSIDLNHSIKLENGVELNLNKYTTNDLGQKIYFTRTNPEKRDEYDVILKGEDNLGNYVEFSIRSRGRFEIESLVSHLSDDAKELTLTPYAVKLPEKNGRISNDYKQIGEEFKISLK
jgi:Family of unknown function (DUF5643)/Domain of unknown function (DUF4179)